MRTITRIILHCTATPEGREYSVAEVRRWHTDPPPKGNGWRDIGYHRLVHLDGSVSLGRPDAQIGAHVAGHNADSLGFAYVGGMTADGRHAKDTRTPAQIETMDRLIDEARAAYGQHITVHGHNEFDARKACPSFNVAADRAKRRR